MKKRKDHDFLTWLTFQPSCLDGTFSEYDDLGRGRNIACHHRTVARGAGMARKPLFSAYPLTFKQHYLTHLYGPSYFNPPEWWEEQAKKYHRMWLDK